MGRIPRSPQSLKDDTVGVGLDPNCPDRSWCVADLPGTRESGDTGRQASPDGPWEETPPSGGERKTRKPGKDTGREKKCSGVGATSKGRESSLSTPLSRATPLRPSAPRGERLHPKAWRT